MKKIFIALTMLAVVASSCNQNRREQNNVTIENNTTSGFDVNKLAQFVKTSTDPETLEKAINNPANQINNLDLDKDGNIDYLKVEEGENNRLKVIDDVSNSESVTVASIRIDTDNASNQADLAIQGNPAYVGYNNYYHSSFSFTDFLLLSYIMRPHAFYVPMYHYGYYPSYYTRVHTYSTFRPTTSSYMSSRMSHRSSLSSPVRSQRSFSTRRSGSFGSGSRRSSFGSSSFRRSSFGSSRGFGRRR
ncbi:MAG: hypothetical protein ACTHMI_18480 [Mucilaginibacter sp.]|uniref:hypothetical protein n=1 Tax=Mucilaginibacter sp. L3T2-6 TaxID=3062491 RepID=UPI00267686B3|nr:hypothetical protein [Mucilaginibacter sp. L3T2-6]MDO3644796.1 hypothetical protein [Mucilaginibacter sp. L3T2-6]MDV6217310.1 hypothetical protein [Mucilaginibacter sp. L3T2-6]